MQRAARGYGTAAPVQNHVAQAKAPACSHLCSHFLVSEKQNLSPPELLLLIGEALIPVTDPICFL